MAAICDSWEDFDMTTVEPSLPVDTKVGVVCGDIIVSDDWESFDMDSAVFSVAKQPSEKVIVASAPVAPDVVTSKKVSEALRNAYVKYPYFIASIQGTVLRTMFPKADKPGGELKKMLESGSVSGLTEFVVTLRNGVIMPMFYVLKSTKFFNPISKIRSNPKKSKERFDPMLLNSVSLEDQVKMYRLFGFQGHVGPKKDDEDVKRDELLFKLKNILYDADVLCHLVQMLFGRLEISIDTDVIKRVCVSLRGRSDYETKAYGLPSRWYHDSTWAKLRYVYGEGSWANFGGGEGQMSRDLDAMNRAAQNFVK